MHQRRKQPNLVPFVVASAFAHLCLCVLYFVLSLSTSPFVEEPHIITVNIVQKGKKRDEQLLPRQVTEELPEEKQMTPHEAPEPTPVPVAAPVHAPVVDKHSLKNEKEPEKKREPSKRANPLDLLKKFSVPSEREGKEDGMERGNSVIGELLDAYKARVLAILHEKFRLPSYIGKSEANRLSVKVRIYIDANGVPTRIKIIRASTNAEYDDLVKTTVTDIESFGSPPLPLQKELKKEGLAIEWCPNKCPTQE